MSVMVIVKELLKLIRITVAGVAFFLATPRRRSPPGRRCLEPQDLSPAEPPFGQTMVEVTLRLARWCT
jgi:hypothetical protein